MNSTKWLMLICTTILSLVPTIILWRDWKHEDKSSKHYGILTVLMVIFTILAGIGIFWGNLKDWSNTPPTPNYVLYLNGVRVTNDSRVLFPMTTNLASLNFGLENKGNLPAENMQVSFFTPEGPQISGSDQWLKGRLLAELPGSVLAPAQVQMFMVERPGLFSPLEALPLPPLTWTIPQDEFKAATRKNLVGIYLPVTIRISAANFQSRFFDLQIMYDKGVQVPHVEKPTQDYVAGSTIFFKELAGNQK